MTGTLKRRLRSGLLGALGTVGMGTASGRLAAAIKDLAVAHRFGTGDALEAFLMAFVLPIFLAGSFRSAFFSAFVPRFLEAEARRGPEAAKQALRRVMAAYLVLLVGLAVILAVAAGPIVEGLAHEFPPDKRALTRQFVVLLSPFVVFDGLAGMFTAALYAKRRYASAALAPAIPPIVTLIAVLGLGSGYGVESLIVGVFVGAVLEAAVTGLLVRRSGLGVIPELVRPGPEEMALLSGFSLLLVGGILMAATTVVDQTMATLAGAGSVASLGYGAKLPAAVLSLAGTALATATLPHYATFVASRRFAEMGSSLKRHAVQLASAGLAIALLLALVSKPLVRLLFEHGSFLPADTARVSTIQAFYAFQIPGFFAGVVAARVLNALGRDRWILGVSAMNFVLNITGNWVGLKLMGLPGIALSTAFVYSVAATVMLFLCRKAIRAEKSNQTA